MKIGFNTKPTNFLFGRGHLFDKSDMQSLGNACTEELQKSIMQEVNTTNS